MTYAARLSEIAVEIDSFERDTIATIDGLSVQAATLQLALDGAQARVRAMQAELDAAGEAGDALRQQVAEAQAIAGELRAKVTELEAEIERLKNPPPPLPGGGGEPDPKPSEPETPPAPAPAPEPAPEPIPQAGQPESYRIWSNHMLKTGCSAREYNRGLDLPWKRTNGDWLDRDGAAYGTAPWHTAQVEIATQLGYESIDITALAQQWKTSGHNKGAYLLVAAGTKANAWATLSGTQSTNPPQLVLSMSDGSTHTLTGDLCGWNLQAASASAPASAIDCSQSFKLSIQSRIVIHFAGLGDLAGDVVQAVMQLHVQGKDDEYPLPIHIMQTNPPPLLLGGAGLPPVYGVAAEVGEENLSSHPSIIAAGDYREENWNNAPGTHPRQNQYVISKRAAPAKLFNNVTMTESQYDKTQVLPDPDMPGRHILRTCVVGSYTDAAGKFIKGNIGGGEMAVYFHDADMSDPMRSPIYDPRAERLFTRVEVFLESDSFWSNLYAFKFSPVGFDGRYGLWDDVKGWNDKGGSIYVYGSGQTKSNGGIGYDSKYNQYLVQGHSMRGHTNGHLHNKWSCYPSVGIAVAAAPSHLGPYDSLNDGGTYGTEQNLRFGRHVIPTGRWVTIESEIKMNSIDLTTVDAFGNGVARNDGEMRFWLDGVMVGERTNLAWRRHPRMGVRGSWQMCYHGGSTPPDHDIWWRLRNFALGMQYIGPVKR